MKNELEKFDDYLNQIVVLSHKLTCFIYNCAAKSAEVNHKGKKQKRDFDRTYLDRISDEMKKLSIFNETFIWELWHKAYDISDKSFKNS